MNIRLLEAAKDDLRSGWSFYERQSPGLGNTFLAAIDSHVQTLALNESSIDIYAILDCRRDPIWIRDRLATSPPPS
jgi:hypothetical protein